MANNNPESVHVTIDGHSVKCYSIFGNNYSMSYTNGKDIYLTHTPRDADCVVCGQKATSTNLCLD